MKFAFFLLFSFFSDLKAGILGDFSQVRNLPGHINLSEPRKFEGLSDYSRYQKLQQRNFSHPFIDSSVKLEFRTPSQFIQEEFVQRQLDVEQVVESALNSAKKSLEIFQEKECLKWKSKGKGECLNAFNDDLEKKIST